MTKRKTKLRSKSPKGLWQKECEQQRRLRLLVLKTPRHLYPKLRARAMELMREAGVR